MSQNTDYFNSSTSPFPSSSSSSHHRNKRISSHQTFLPTPSEYNTPSSMTNTLQHDSPSPTSFMSPIVNDVCINSQNGVRNTLTVAKVKDNTLPHSNYIQDKYSFTLNFASSSLNPRKEQTSRTKSRFYSSDMNTQQYQDLHSPFELDVPICDQNQVGKMQSDFLIDRMLKDDHNSQFSASYRSTESSMQSAVLNSLSPLATPLSDHRDIDTLSDAGTYVIEDDRDIARDDEPEQDIDQIDDDHDHTSVSSSSITSPFRRYVTKKRNRHGTFEIQRLTSNDNQSVMRPIVDLNTPNHDLSSPLSTSSKSSSSSLLSLPTESDNSPRKESEDISHNLIDHQTSTDVAFHRQRPNTLVEQKRPNTPPQTQIKPAECFVISPTFETKNFFNNNAPVPRRRIDQPWKVKSTASATPGKDLSIEVASKNSPRSPPTSTRTINNDSGRFSFRLQQTSHNQEQKPPVSNSKATGNTDHSVTTPKTSTRPHTLIPDQTTSSSPFQRHAAIRQTMPANIQHQRPTSSSTTSSTAKYVDDQDEALLEHPSLTKVYMNKSFALRRQRSNITPSQTKPIQVQQSQMGQISSVPKTLITRQPLKPTVPLNNQTSTNSQTSGSSGQTNRAVELRRARAQAKIEELAQRTRHQLQKTEQHNDMMSASWHSNASSGKRDPFHQKSTSRMTNSSLPTNKQDMLRTRTITSAPHHRSSSASPNPAAESGPSLRNRRTMVSSVTDEAQYGKMNDSVQSENGRGELLRDDGQRLAIKLIQLSSGILAKLKPSTATGDSDANIRDLEQLVDKLQTVNRTLSTIDASLPTPGQDDKTV